ncbi:tRNA glutamyl-Q(34) synthetase GluQRS [uncultured Enterovirga sp.]|uniref:tRNA glutamyl-Q(34) synthetase GluQRS n=1 Tax=uncultured Enterovirga sp. TaxID=2026352 RepID=UPI0035CA1141
MTRPRFRFAPSPNGRLHLGHAYSALLNERMAEAAGGRLLLRIEDIDPVRSKPHLVDAIIADLAWLGLRWEEPVRRQSQHLEDYARASRQLCEAGLVYPCFCTRSEVQGAAEAARPGEPAPRDPDGAPLYPGTCRRPITTDWAIREAEHRVPVWRLDTRAALARLQGAPIGWTRIAADGQDSWREARPLLWGDPVVVRRDVGTSYHLSVVTDDALQGITHVVRGRDLEAATDLHALLQALLSLPAPLYHHHDLVLDTGGAKLSKSLGSASLDQARAAGASPADIRRALGFEGRP